MKILVATGSTEPSYCTGKCLLQAFKDAEHDVCLAGAVYGRTDISMPHEEQADIDVSDKPYPETYFYDEILDKAPWKPDFILQIEPHFYFVGDKPKDIKSFYWVLDPHRGGMAHRNMAEYGHFDAIFISQKWFADSYIAKGMNCFWVPLAFDPNRIKYYPDVTPECDIAFIGRTGAIFQKEDFNMVDSDGFRYTNKIKQPIKFSSPYEYRERAALLNMLTKDFDVRIYDKQIGDNYCKILQKGRVGFHRSLFNDITLRVFEIMACKRVLVADDIPFIRELIQNNAILYQQYGFNPELANFELDYEFVKRKLECILDHNEERESMAEKGQEYVLKNHTFKARAEQIIKMVEKLYL